VATVAHIRTAAGTRLATRGSGLVGLDSLAREAGVHPDLVRRLAALGLIAPAGGTATDPRFHRQDALALARAVRLRRDLGLNYAGAVLACELLARIDELERRLALKQHEVITWTRTV
jgi:DNA-binding transcriptional MerR regulator